VARNSLKEAKRQAIQFSINIDGFDKADAEINRIEDAIRAGTPTEITGMQETNADAAYSSDARDLLKEATSLKKEKKYAEACEKLRKAYRADGAENLMIEERLRLPMYLQLAGRNDEGWDELNRLNAKYSDIFSQPIIANQMRVFLKKENNETASNPARIILRVESKEQKTDSNSKSVKMLELQNAPMPDWMDEHWNGFEFCATLQLRTPLRVLLRHNEIYIKNDGHQPQIAREPWEGVWMPKLKWNELGIAGTNKFPEFTHASDVGQILAKDYLPFLIAVRKILELPDSIENRIKLLREKPSEGDWQTYVEKHGGIERIIRQFFPRFVCTSRRLTTRQLPNYQDWVWIHRTALRPHQMKQC
jgi:hypothetical protein